jgi:hypothetical protein
LPSFLQFESPDIRLGESSNEPLLFINYLRMLKAPTQC